MLLRVALVRTNVSEELSASFIEVTRIGEIGTTLVVTSNVRRWLVTASVVPSSPILVTPMKEAQSSSETSVLRRAISLGISSQRASVAASVVPSSPILVTLMKKALSSLQDPHGITSQKTPFFR
jgi:hypothetical protein